MSVGEVAALLVIVAAYHALWLWYGYRWGYEQAESDLWWRSRDEPTMKEWRRGSRG